MNSDWLYIVDQSPVYIIYSLMSIGLILFHLAFYVVIYTCAKWLEDTTILIW